MRQQQQARRMNLRRLAAKASCGKMQAQQVPLQHASTLKMLEAGPRTQRVCM